jgi:septal ring factor EnvC (AmiA/AmiB activator)
MKKKSTNDVKVISHEESYWKIYKRQSEEILHQLEQKLKYLPFEIENTKEQINKAKEKLKKFSKDNAL